jgi:predicted DNA-binding transcriptional regulator AlpA
MGASVGRPWYNATIMVVLDQSSRGIPVELTELDVVARLRQHRRQLRRQLDASMLLTVTATAKLLGMSEKALRRADQTGKVPAPVRIGRNVRWRLAELARWAEADCPDRETWEAMRHGT